MGMCAGMYNVCFTLNQIIKSSLVDAWHTSANIWTWISNTEFIKFTKFVVHLLDEYNFFVENVLFALFRGAEICHSIVIEHSNEANNREPGPVDNFRKYMKRKILIPTNNGFWEYSSCFNSYPEFQHEFIHESALLYINSRDKGRFTLHNFCLKLSHATCLQLELYCVNKRQRRRVVCLIYTVQLKL
jgi:hypothetical protein